MMSQAGSASYKNHACHGRNRSVNRVRQIARATGIVEVLQTLPGSQKAS
jgi:hypothetical protein